MDFSELIRRRRSIRDFTDEKVPEALVLEVLRECRPAPSSYNGQPWRFIIVNNSETIKKISDECKKNNLAKLRENPESPLKLDESDLLDENYNIFYNAPTVVFIVGPTDVPSLDVDCALFASYFMLSAAAKGWGTCWVGLGVNISDPPLLKEIGLPGDHRIVAPIIMGRPNSIPEATDRRDPVVIKIV